METWLEIFFLSIQILYFLFVFWLFWGWDKSTSFDCKLEEFPKVSVLIPFRNEAKNLPTLLNSITQLNYPKDAFEVIFLNDQSEDNGVDLIFDFFKNTAIHFTVENIPTEGYVSTKKRAISHGVKMANGEIIICTDADSQFAANWLNVIVSQFVYERDVVFVSSPVVFPDSKKLFNKIQQIEFLSLVGSGGSLINHGLPAMCNGANMAFTKNAFLSINGYHGLGDYISGDDEFLMHRFADNFPNGIRFLNKKESTVVTKPNLSLSDLINQRKRWASKWKLYDRFYIKLIALGVFTYHLVSFVFMLLIICGLFNVSLFVEGLLLRLVVEYILLKNVAKSLNVKFNVFVFAFLVPLYPFYAIFVGILSNIGKYTWKGRVYKV